MKSIKLNAVTLMFLILLVFPVNAKTLKFFVSEKFSGRPISYATIIVSNKGDILAVAETDTLGVCLLGDIKADKIIFKVSRTGYLPISMGPISLTKNDTLKLFVQLDVSEMIMPETVVSEEKKDKVIELSGFNKRKELLHGKFFNYKEIEEKGFRSTSDLTALIPDLYIEKSSISTKGERTKIDGEVIYSKKGRLGPVNIYVDGVSVENCGLTTFFSTQIAAIEFYDNGINAPSEYGGGWRSGGVLLIWTVKPED